MGYNGIPPAHIPKQKRDVGDPQYNEFDDYWWPKILYECDEYQRSLESRRFDRLIIACSSIVLIVAILLASAVACHVYQHWNDPPSQSSVNVPYTYRD